MLGCGLRSAERLTSIGNIYSDQAYASSGGRHPNAVVDNFALAWFEFLVDAFEANAVATTCHTLWFMFQDLCDRVAFGEIDGDGADRFGFLESGRYVVDGIDRASATQDRAVGATESPAWKLAQSSANQAVGQMSEIKR